MALYSIGEVAERCNINPVTLRAWQRRYGLLKPQRTEGGHRLFDEDDIQRIEEIKSWIQKGTPVSKVRPLLESEIRPNGNDWAAQQDELISVIRQASASRLRARIVKFTREYSVDDLTAHILNPVRQRLRLEHHTAQIVSGLLEGVLVQHIAAALEDSLRRHGKDILLLAWNVEDRTGLWLEAWRLSQTGLHVTVLPENQLTPRPELFPGQTLYVWTGSKISVRQAELLQHWNEQGYSVMVHTS